MKISYNPGGGAQESVTVPLRMLVVADFGLGQATRGPVMLQTAGDVQDLLKDWAPELFFEVDDLLGGGGRIEFRHKVATLKDLSPARIVAALPALKRAREIVDQVEKATSVAAMAPLAEQVKDLRMLAAVLRQQPAAPPAAPASAGAPASAAGGDGDGVDRLLDMVDVPDRDAAREEQAKSAIGSIVGQIGKKRSKPSQSGPPELRQVKRLAAELVAAQLDAVLHHPELQAVESAWRGLRWLVDRTDFREGIRLEVAHVERKALGDEFSDCVDSAEQEPFPPDLIVAPYQFDDPTVHGELLQRLAEVAEYAQSPLLTSVGAGFFEVAAESAGEMGFTATLLEQAQYQKYSALRTKDCARWLSVAFNRFLLREPYTPDNSRGLAHVEVIAGNEDYLWGDAVWLVAALIARSFARTGWMTEILGRQDGRVPDLAVHPVRTKSGREVKIPLEAPLSSQLVEDLLREGFINLQAPPNSDAAFLVGAPTVHQRADEPHRRVATALPYQLVLGRVVHAIGWYRSELLAEREPAAVQAGLEGFLRGLIADSGLGAGVQAAVKADPKHLGALQVALELKTGRGVLGGVTIALQFSIG